MFLLDIAIPLIIALGAYAIYLGYSAYSMGVSFWKKRIKEDEERDRNNEIYYRDFMRG